MKIVGIAVVRNEADIIETFVRYHRQFCDALLIVDHLSCDGCAEILDAIAAGDSRVKFFRDRRAGFFQREIMTRLARIAAREFRADWILALDGDEFIGTDSADGVRATLENLPSGQLFRIPWRTYVPRPQDDFRAGNVLAHIQHRRADEARKFHKIVVPGVLAKKPGVCIGDGNHHLLDTSRSLRPKIRALNVANLFLGHYPVRSSSQIVTRSVIGWLSRVALGEQERALGYHVLSLFERLRSGSPLSAVELTNMAYAYPSRYGRFPPAGELVAAPQRFELGTPQLRFEDRIRQDPFSAVVNCAEAMARELGRGRTEQLDLQMRNHPWWRRMVNRRRRSRSARSAMAD